MSYVSERLRGLRRGLGMTQAAAAERLGVSQTTVSAWERDVGVASVRDLRRLLALYGATDADRLSVLAVEASP